MPAGKSWYTYDTLSNLGLFERLLTGDRRNLISLAGGSPVLDIGCGDGDLAFFFESLGLDVHAIDHPATNYNGMTGVNLLKTALHSGVKLFVQDLDKQFSLPGVSYGLTFLLGVLYHLRNPYYVLETLSLSTRYCILSTRIAGFSPDHRTGFSHLPIAYLLDDLELNADHTNFWIFSEQGLRTLLKRTGWYVRDFMTVGPADSDPVNSSNDQRAFCLLESARLIPREDGRLRSGWYELTEGARWTEKRFSFVMQWSFEPGMAEIALRFALPDALVALRPEVSLQAFVDGVPLEREVYTTSGEQLYRQKFSVPARPDSDLIVEFEVDQAAAAPPPDARELGVYVLFDSWFPLILMRP